MENPRNLADQSRSYVSIELEARLVRKCLGLGPEDPLPSIELFEGLGQLTTVQKNILVTYGVEELNYGVEAETRYLREPRSIEVVLDTHTYTLLESEVPRARFCLAHEIGHVALHYAELARLSRLPGATAGLARADGRDVPRYLDVEWQANAFASALLMPASALAQLDRMGRLCAEELMALFNVSKTSAKIRLNIFDQKRGAFASLTG